MKIFRCTRLVILALTLCISACSDSGSEQSGESQVQNLRPVMDAIKMGDTAALKQELDSGIDVNGKDADNYTPLIMACAQGNVTVVKLLLSRGAKVDYAPEGMDVPLIVASRSGSVPVIQALLAGGVDVNSTTIEGQTATECAEVAGKFDAMHYLISQGGHK